MVLHITSKARYAQSVVTSMCCMDFDVAIALQKHHLAVIIADHLECRNLRVETALKFDGQIANFKAFDTWFICACGQYKLLIGAHTYACTNAGHIKVLDELDLSPRIHLLHQLWALAAIGEPLYRNQTLIRCCINETYHYLHLAPTCRRSGYRFSHRSLRWQTLLHFKIKYRA